jgi:hypothetical protein
MTFAPKQHMAEAPITPQAVAQALRESLDREDSPLQEGDLLRWGVGYGLEAQLRQVLDPEWSPQRYSVTGEVLADPPLKGREALQALRGLISAHPEAFQDVEQAVAQLRRHWVKGQAEKLEACGSTWRGHVVRIFWRDRKGRERLRRQIGIHRCKGAWCPSCGRTRQASLAGQVEKLLVLAEDWGFHAGHARLVTLTTPNGSHLPTLREQAHQAFARLQRTRWWNRHTFGFVRGSEVKTGEDGNWNFHIHFLLIFWHPRMDYADLSDHWTAALGGQREGEKNFTVDVESLEAKAWERKDGKGGILGRRNLVRAARYISKYLCKGEELANLKKGPGGLSHLVASTKGMRRAAFGGGCAVLRRTAHVLMPKQLHQAEELLAGSPLHEGRSPLRLEVMDPETGELVDLDPAPLEDARTQGLRAWGEALETNPDVISEASARKGKGWKLPGRVVGIPCGPNGRHRRIGVVPLASAQPTVKAFEAWKRQAGEDLPPPCPLEGVRALVAGGAWRVYRWDRISRKTGRLLHYAAVLPAERYAWRPVRAAVLAGFGRDTWAAMRARAHAIYAEQAVDGRMKEDAKRQIGTGLKQALSQARTYRNGWTSELRDLRWTLATGQGHAALQQRACELERALGHLPEPVPHRPEPQRASTFSVNLL